MGLKRKMSGKKVGRKRSSGRKAMGKRSHPSRDSRRVSNSWAISAFEEKKKEFQDLSSKFKELKSLVYQYRDSKENEINLLTENQASFKEEIEKNKDKHIFVQARI